MPILDSTPPPNDHDDELRRAYERIDSLEIAIRRLTAEVLRLKATGEDQAANQLEAELREHQDRVARDRRVVELYSPFDHLPSLERRPPPTSRATTVVERESTVGPPPEEQQPGDYPTVADEIPVVAPSEKDEATSYAKRKARRRWAVWDIRKQPGVTASTLVHAAILVALALLGFAHIPNPPPMLSSGTIEDADAVVDQLAEVSLEPLEIIDADVEEMPFESIAPEPPPLEVNLSVPGLELAAVDAPVVSAAGDLMTLDAATLLAEIGEGGAADGAADGDLPQAGEGEASFFGKRSRGNRFVFLIDNSGTMKDGRLETAFLELLNSVGGMKPDQMFYVVFYSDQAYPMFHPDGVNELVAATRENKRKLEAWLATVEMCTGGEINDAVDLATSLEPAAVYVLSDGDIYESRIRRLVEKAPQRDYPIHTLGMTLRNQSHAANLVAIAEAHRGTFTPVGIHPQAVQMSRTRPIRYNREPNAVWGTKIRSW